MLAAVSRLLAQPANVILKGAGEASLAATARVFQVQRHERAH
jgi:hypothetical protein